MAAAALLLLLPAWPAWGQEEDEAAGEPQDNVEWMKVGGDGETKVGTPVVEGAAVKAKVIAHQLGAKRDAFKYQRRKRKPGKRMVIVTENYNHQYVH